MNSFILWIKEFFVWHSSQFDKFHKLFDKDTCQKEKEVLQ